MIRCAVVVPCRNEAAHLPALLTALAGQSRRPDEVVIVDDRSTDDTVDVIRRWAQVHPDPPVCVVAGEGRGPGPAMNTGIRSTTASIIVRIDGHAVPGPEYVEHSLAALAESSVGVVGGVWQVAPGAETATARAIAAVVSHPLGSGGALYRAAGAARADQQAVETVPFGTFTKSLWERIGGYDERLSANEDFDFNYRVRRAGLKVVLDRRISSTYVARSTVGALSTQYARYGFWKRRMLHKDARAFHLRQLPPILAMPWVIVSLGLAAAWPSVLTAAMAAGYPLLVLGGGGLIGVSRRVSPLAAAIAIAVVHLSWSAGFWRGTLIPRDAEG